MAATKHHDYHLVNPSPWPLVGAIAAFFFFGGFVMWLHANRYGPVMMGIGLAANARRRSVKRSEKRDRNVHLRSGEEAVPAIASAIIARVMNRVR